jgi:diguanylate cyclase (GGDEF)-like protein
VSFVEQKTHAGLNAIRFLVPGTYQVLVGRQDNGVPVIWKKTVVVKTAEPLQTDEETPPPVAVVDVNGLREVNNRFGHMAGDDLLRRAAEFLRRNVRGSDEVVRWGGDEFLILMPQTDDAQAAAAARRLKDAVAAHDGGSSAAILLSISIGVSAWAPGRSLEDIVGAADARMYEEKRRSRQAGPEHRRGAEAGDVP